MDKSKEYIKMCNCPEIQSRQCYRKDDYIASNPFGDGTVWLPRQDQLQGMIDWDCVCITKPGNMEICMEVYEDREQMYCLEFNSMEQLWLAFVMFELYGKKWNEERWTNSTRQGMNYGQTKGK